MPNNNSIAVGKRGFPLPLGATVLPDGINFAVFSRHATSVELVIELVDEVTGDVENYTFTLLPDYNRTGDVWHILLPLYWKRVRYGYRIDGESTKERGTIFSPADVLIDPYCRKLLPRKWGEPSPYGTKPCCLIPRHSFDWHGETPIKRPLSETIIYELHVRGFTQSPTSNVEHRGTYRGIIEKIPYLKSLGITAVELMPVAEFDENDTNFTDPDSGKSLKNFWGYSTVNFFTLKSGYASNTDDYMLEFKEMVRTLHSAGIEVILDIVFNHTGESGYDGTTTSFRGLDNPIYYLMDPSTKEYMNFSGCGNTMNCNHPVVRELIRSVLRYWVVEMHVDGFRFDLASILGRDQKGNVLPDPPMLELIAEDPVLRDTKIIAEAWDAAGLYQVGSFSTDARWSEWNGKFRDDVRSFFAGHPDSVTKLATRIAGSSDLYQPSSRGPSNSINLITSHDGFTLYDLVSYERKHNLKNGENNRDGESNNLSWNSGKEGQTPDARIESLRLRRMKSMALVLFLSQGVPMFTAGDEFGRSQGGNNNPWCQDNATSWIDWTLAEKNTGLLRFFRSCIALRKEHSVFRRDSFFDETDDTRGEIIWQAERPGKTNWLADCHHLAFLLNGKKLGENHFFIMLNGYRDRAVDFTIAPVPENPGEKWYRIVDTSKDSPEDFVSVKHASPLRGDDTIRIPPMAAVVLQTR